MLFPQVREGLFDVLMNTFDNLLAFSTLNVRFFIQWGFSLRVAVSVHANSDDEGCSAMLTLFNAFCLFVQFRLIISQV